MSYRRKVKRKINSKKFFLKKFLYIILLLIISFFVRQNLNQNNVYVQKVEQMQNFDEKLSVASDTEIKTFIHPCWFIPLSIPLERKWQIVQSI